MSDVWCKQAAMSGSACPFQLRRIVPVRGINPIPVLSARLDMIRELMMRDWPLLRPACRQVPGVRQFTFRNDFKLSAEAYQLTPGSFADHIYARIHARKTHASVRFPLPPRRALSPADASRSCRSRTATPSAVAPGSATAVSSPPASAAAAASPSAAADAAPRPLLPPPPLAPAAALAAVAVPAIAAAADGPPDVARWSANGRGGQPSPR